MGLLRILKQHSLTILKKVEALLEDEVKTVENELSEAGRRYGFIPDLPDHRDFKAVHPTDNRPLKVDLRQTGFLPPVWDQGQLGSCVAHASGAAYYFCLAKEKLPVWDPSRLYIYFNARDLEGTTNQDNGCAIRDAVKALASLGVCSTDLWPYDTTKYTVKPSDPCYKMGQTDQVTQYYRVDQSEEGIESALAAGFPVIFGATIYASFESEAVAASGIVSMPNTSENCMGGHALLIVGYDHTTRRYLVRNSWSAAWGQEGYFWIPYDYVHNLDLACDFWVLQLVK